MADGAPVIRVGASVDEQVSRQRFVDLMGAAPIPKGETLENLPLFLNRQTLTNVLFINDIYQRILNVPGVIMEFGVRWGRNMALFSNLRGVYEPFNHTRRVVGFDTFSGFPSVAAEDGTAVFKQAGAYGVSDGYDAYLRAVLAYHENESPIAHIKKHEIIKGDVTETLPAYLRHHPETLISLAYFDMDIYEPTAHCLETIRARLLPGALIAFDEVNCADFPGETLAVLEKMPRLALQRSNFAGHQAFAVVT